MYSLHVIVAKSCRHSRHYKVNIDSVQDGFQDGSEFLKPRK